MISAPSPGLPTGFHSDTFDRVLAEMTEHDNPRRGFIDWKQREQDQYDARTPTLHNNRVVSVAEKKRLLALEAEEIEARRAWDAENERLRQEESEKQAARHAHSERIVEALYPGVEW